MRDYITIGSSPPDEDCAQAGSLDYADVAHEECRRYIDCIRKKLGPEPLGAKLGIKKFPHDGIRPGDIVEYLEVVCYFDTELPDSQEYAYRCESEGPLTWEG